MSHHTIELQDYKKQLEHQIAVKDAIVRLVSNPDFEKVILKAYLQEEALRAISNSIQNTLHQDNVDQSIAKAQATAYLRQWFDLAIKSGQNAENELRDVNDSLMTMDINDE